MGLQRTLFFLILPTDLLQGVPSSSSSLGCPLRAPPWQAGVQKVAGQSWACVGKKANAFSAVSVSYFPDLMLKN